jgi:hypothetical protein
LDAGELQEEALLAKVFKLQVRAELREAALDYLAVCAVPVQNE